MVDQHWKAGDEVYVESGCGEYFPDEIETVQECRVILESGGTANLDEILPRLHVDSWERVRDALEDALSRYPRLEDLELLDDDSLSGTRPCVADRSPRIADVRRWRTLLRSVYGEQAKEEGWNDDE